MSSALKGLQDKVNQLQKRERALLLITLLAFIYLIAELIWLGPDHRAAADLTKRTGEANIALKGAQKELDSLVAETRQSENAHLRAQIEGLQQQVAQQQNTITSHTVGMVSAADLPRILEDVLVKTGCLSLLKLKALPVEELTLDTSDENGEPLGAGIYKHSVRITLEGRYGDVVKYLQALEKMPWDFNWEELAYKVESHPNASVELQVYTLTTERGLFGHG